MKDIKQKKQNLFVRKRLADLKLKLDRVTSSWTVDNYSDLLNFYVKVLPSILDAERSTVYLIEMATDKICSIFGTGLEEQRIEPPRQGSVVGKVISSGQGVIVNDLQNHPGYHAQISFKDGFQPRNMVCVPILSTTDQRVTGAVQVLNKGNNGLFNEEDLALLAEFAGYLAISIESIILNQEIIRITTQLNREIENSGNGCLVDTPFIAESEAMYTVLDTVRQVSGLPVSVLIHGDNGTGKELIARLIHQLSDRRDKPFVAVNCAAIPENLMESEFFGYERGAFTGANSSRMGRFEEANGGTLMLDEIGDMPLSIQPKFLRAIQEGEGNRLGSNMVIPYDFRIISATNKNLEQEVERGAFRRDLYFRLFSVEIYTPPLRERQEDILPLAFSFFEEICHRFGKKIPGFSKEVLRLFKNFDWPGNVRQLRHEVERLVALTPAGQYIEPGACSPELRQPPKDTGKAADYSLPDQVKSLEMELIKKALRETAGNRMQAAKLLHITRQGLHKKMNRYQMNQ